MELTKGLTLHKPYIPLAEKQAADELADFACICCGKRNHYISGDKGTQKKIDAVVYYLVGMKCMCGFINFVYLVCNDLKNFRHKHWMPAAKALDEAVKHGHLENPWLKEMLVRTQALVYKGKAEEALKMSTRCIAEYPNNASATYNQGCILMLLQRYDEAIPFLRRVIDLDDKFVSSWYQLARVYWATSEFENALLCFDTFLNRVPNHKEAQEARAQCMREKSNLN